MCRIDEFLGPVCDSRSLKLGRAIQFLRFVLSVRNNIFSRIDETRSISCESIYFESVVLTVEVQLPQHPVNDIKKYEKIAVRFSSDEGEIPETLALRDDFGTFPHQNLRDFDFPKSLCLYDGDPEEILLGWNPKDHHSRVRRWLSATASGELHLESQALEPFLADTGWYIIAPPNFGSESAEDLDIAKLVAVSDSAKKRQVLVPLDSSNEMGRPFYATSVTGKPMEHGIINRTPKDLGELSNFLSIAGIDVYDELSKAFSKFPSTKCDLNESSFLLVVNLPKMRKVHDELVESMEKWAFLFLKPLPVILCDVGLYAKCPTTELVSPILGEKPNLESLKEVDLLPVKVLDQLTPKLASVYNGTIEYSGSVLAVGAGAIGSHVIMNLIQSGFGKWTIIDHDLLFPHNLAKHSLPGFFQGQEKATALAKKINSIFAEDIAKAIPANVLKLAEVHKEDLGETVESADIILDFSASVSVSKYLSLDLVSDCRRISVFLNPSAEQLVILAEDKSRKAKLDQLEVSLYQAILDNAELSNHLEYHGENRFHYGAGCRDLSSIVAQDVLSLFSGIASRKIKDLANSDAPSIEVFQLSNSNEVKRHSPEVLQWNMHDTDCGIIQINQKLIENVAKFRAESLPNETGGVLIGHVDRRRKICYISDALPAPPDSKSWPTSYIRGSVNLENRVSEISRLTLGNLHYIGEWHSHPDDCSLEPSDDDLKAFAWLNGHMADECLPAIMLILGKDQNYSLISSGSTYGEGESKKSK